MTVEQLADEIINEIEQSTAVIGNDYENNMDFESVSKNYIDGGISLHIPIKNNNNRFEVTLLEKDYPHVTEVRYYVGRPVSKTEITKEEVINFIIN